MKKFISLTLVVMVSTCSLHAQSQTPEERAGQIAQKVKDSLSLSEQQRIQLYNVNLPLANQEAVIRRQFPGASSLSYYLKEMELTRDSLYRAVLPADKYLQYKLKKQNIIHHD